jgi:hypothetical protein
MKVVDIIGDCGSVAVAPAPSNTLDLGADGPNRTGTARMVHERPGMPLALEGVILASCARSLTVASPPNGAGQKPPNGPKSRIASRASRRLTTDADAPDSPVPLILKIANFQFRSLSCMIALMR